MQETACCHVKKLLPRGTGRPPITWYTLYPTLEPVWRFLSADLHVSSSNTAFGSSGVKGNVIIKSPDTDVPVLAVHCFPKMDHIDCIWIETGVITNTTDKRRFIPVHAICASLGHDCYHILLAVHALTGCDSVSSHFGKGKVLKIFSRPRELCSLQIFPC